MDAVALFGTAIGVAALVLALVSVMRSVPALAVEPGPDSYWRVRHSGPSSLVIVRAFIVDEDQTHQPLGEGVPELERGEMETAGMLLATSDNPWCKGRLLVPHYTYLLEPVSVSRDLVVTYRIQGAFGFLSRASLRLTGGP